MTPQNQEPFPVDKLQTFPQLSPAAFQHPDDLKATATLQTVPVFPSIVKALAGSIFEKADHLHHLSECIRVGPRQAVELYRVYVKAAEILSIPTLPELFISPEFEVNAYASGMKHHVIVVTRGLVQNFTMPEIMGVLGHELGHVKCGHMANKTVASMVAEIGLAGIGRIIPFLGEAAMLPVLAHLQYWSRMAELSCDRAALLVVQDPRVVGSMLAKIGGWPPKLGEIDFQSLREQGEEYDKLDEDTVSAAFKIINMLQSQLYLTHPLPIQRVRRILLWAESHMYEEILKGNYPRLQESLPTPRCRVCGTMLRPADQHCTGCGTLAEPQQIAEGPACANCGYPVPSPAPRFCGRCGKPFSAGAAV